MLNLSVIYYYCVFFLLLIVCNRTQQLEIPFVPCPSYFQYQFDNFQYIGKISIPTVSNSIELVVHLSQRQPILTNYYGRIVLEKRDPLIYRVEFPTADEVPKVTKIAVNGEEICAQSEHSAPSTRLFLSHKLTVQALTSTLPRIQKQPIVSPTNTQSTYSQFFLPPVKVQSPQKKPQSTRPNIQINSVVKNVQCGIGNAVTPLVFGGYEIRHGEFPWLTAIYVKSAGLRFLCGGSLISPRTVISAGHCFEIGKITASRLVVQVGRHNLEDFSETGFLTLEVQNLIVHPDYNTNLFPDADLAILQLKQSVQFSSNVRPICLWPKNSETRHIVGETGMVAGWGADEQGHSYTPVPKKVDTKIVSDSECLRSSAAYNLLTSPRTFCAGNRDNTGPCLGDSGSGLMISRNGRWYLRGIVSAGQTKDRKCNLQEFVVFCDVAKHLQWLQTNLVS